MNEISAYDLISLIDEYTLKKYVADNYAPEDVYDVYYLERWAEENGYVKDE